MNATDTKILRDKALHAETDLEHQTRKLVMLQGVLDRKQYDRGKRPQVLAEISRCKGALKSLGDSDRSRR